MQEERLNTLIELAQKKAGVTQPGVSRQPLLLVAYPSGHWVVYEAPVGPVDLPADNTDKPVALADALEAYILKR